MKKITLFVIVLTLSTSCGLKQIKSDSERNTASLEKSSDVESNPDRAVLTETDPEVEEIDTISQMPKSSEDLSDSVEQIPTEMNGLVIKWIKFFQGRGRGLMEKYLSRSSRYIPMMKQVLKDRGLPEDLVYIALIESGFSPRALSHAGAVGYWQFMRGTGKEYGLKISALIDERRDPVLSTQAAADYFSGLYNLFGSWYLAIASYNAGENKIKRLVMTHHTRDFWELVRKGRLPSETINYVPKYIAARLIAKHPEKYGFNNIDYSNPIKYDEVKIEGMISLRKLAQKLSIDIAHLRSLNPAFKTEVALPSRGREFNLRVPVGMADKAQEIIAQVKLRETPRLLASARGEEPSVSRYKVRRGDTLIGIASRNNVSVSQIAKANRLSPRSNLYIGQSLLIPKNGIASRARSELRNNSARIHKVKRGETLAAIAKKYRVSMRELAQVNQIKSKSRLLVGDKIQIPD